MSHYGHSVMNVHLNGNHLAAMGETCPEIASKIEIFSRLAAKTDKSAATRASAAAQVQAYTIDYENCLRAQAGVPPVGTPIGPPPGAEPPKGILVTPKPEGGYQFNWLMIAGIAGAVGIGAYLFFRRKKS